MAQYMFLYRGPATKMEEMSQEAIAEEMGKWAIWMEKVGVALKDPGNPFGQKVGISDNGSESQVCDVNGYSLVEADSLEDAKALTDGHPHIAGNDGKFSIDVFEIVPIEM